MNIYNINARVLDGNPIFNITFKIMNEKDLDLLRMVVNSIISDHFCIGFVFDKNMFEIKYNVLYELQIILSKEKDEITLGRPVIKRNKKKAEQV